MIFTKRFCENNIFFDPNEEYLFDADEVYLTETVVYPMVEFSLPCTYGLIAAADELRKEKGHGPLRDGWYNFYICLNGFNDTGVEDYMNVVVNDDSAEDDYACYSIDLDEEEQLNIWYRLDVLCRKHYGKGCEELLSEAMAWIGMEE